MKHKTQTEFIISIEDILEWMNERVKDLGYKELVKEDIERIYLGLEECYSEHVDSLYVIIKKSKSIEF